MTILKTAVGNYPHTKGLKDGAVSVPGLQFEHVEISPIIGAFRRMCRTLEFDLCEMAITTYLTAKAHNKPFTALPIFVVRQFHHSPIVYNAIGLCTSCLLRYWGERATPPLSVRVSTGGRCTA